MAERTCTTDGCGQPHYSKGMCKPCYRRDYYARNGGRERSSNAAWRAGNREHERDRWAAYYGDNAERLREAKREHYAANRERALEIARRYRESHPDASAKWRAANPEAFMFANRANVANARALRVDPEAKRLRADDLRAVLDEWGMFCHICESGIDAIADLHFDHVIPLTLDGPNTPDNLRPAHATCNLQKRNKLLD